MLSPLNSEARAFAELKAKIAEAFDLDENDEAVLDTVEGQSTLHEMILASIRYAKRREAMADAMSAIIKDNQERKGRHERAAEAIRAAVTQAMQEAGVPKVEAADITITQRRSKPKPVVVDETQLPAWAITYKAVPNRKAIESHFEVDGADFECPGVVIANGEGGIIVRTK